MNDLRLLAELVRRGCRWYAQHGLLSTLGRMRGLSGDRRGPSWRSYLRWQAAEDASAPAGAAPSDALGSPGAGASSSGSTALQPARGPGPSSGAAPLLSIIVPVHDPPPALLAALVASVQAQDEPRWELCLADDGSRSAELQQCLSRLARDDPRVRCLRLQQSTGISAASNAAAASARGEVLLFADHDDELARGVLRRVAAAFEAQPELDLAYTDEDQLTPWGLRVLPVFKPGASPFLALGFNYVTHLMAVRRDLFEALGGLRAAYDGSQDHDLLLRALERARAVRHLPGIGYHWRRSRGSVAASSTAKPWAFEAGRRAVEDACRRRGLPVVRVRPGAIAGVCALELRPLAAPVACDVVLRGPERGCAAWTLLLGTLHDALLPRTVTRNAWPAAPGELPLLVVDATLQPDPAALRALLPWTAAPGVGAVAAPACSLRHRRDLGYSITRRGYAQPILPGLPLAAAGPGLLASSVREVAAAGGGLLWVAPPSPAWCRAAAAAPASLAAELCLSMVHAPARLATLLLPGCRPRVARPPLSAAPPVDLTSCPVWEPLAAGLPEEFWERGADRFCPRHELLTELGLPAPLGTAPQAWGAAATEGGAAGTPGRAAGGAQSASTTV